MSAEYMWGYSDRLSAKPGETVTLFLSASGRSCDIEVTRLGRERRTVWQKAGVVVGAHATPVNAHIHG